MNKLERAFADLLVIRQAAGDVQLWRYEAVKFRLADGCWYTPDFFVLDKWGQPWLYEVKGFWRDDAKVKLKVAAETFREYRFVAVSQNRKEWIYEEF